LINGIAQWHGGPTVLVIIFAMHLRELSGPSLWVVITTECNSCISRDIWESSATHTLDLLVMVLESQKHNIVVHTKCHKYRQRLSSSHMTAALW
jgi:hypothetical protein